MGKKMGRGKGSKPPKKLPGKYFENLRKVVMESICCNCAACVAACPVKGISITSYSSPPYFPEWENNCTDCGFCVRVCPRWDYVPLNGLGNYIEALAVKSKRFSGQDGGAVTEILVSAMERDMIDFALVVTKDENWRPIAFLASSVEEVINASGTKYSHAFPLSALKGLRGKGNERIAVVGTPCVVSAVRKLQSEMGKFARKIRFVIGLFCMENFYYPQLMEFLQKRDIDVTSIEKMDIKKGKFIIYPSDISFPVKDLNNIVPSGCKVCQDFTSVQSDVSVGSVGSPDGFSTVIVRNPEFLSTVKSLNAEFGDVDLDVVEKLANFKVKIHPVK
ncbi:MAG: F420H(2):quinone oxidoreductase [Archaeoglobus sp.]|nr:MAG: F420H(2):quinone oxidoreductase [Archaeoglobus sp.]